MEGENVNYLIGDLSGQLRAQTQQLTDIQSRLVSMDARLRVAENNTTKLTVQMGLVGIISGGIGSALLQVITSLILKR